MPDFSLQFVVGKQFPDVVIPLIDAAKSSIKIIVFDWRWYPSEPGNPAQLFNQAIARSLKRGVDVAAIVNHEDIKRTLETLGVKVKKLPTKNLVHVKLMIIDNQVAILGSHNYTQSAFTLNFELSVALFNPPEIGRLISFFDNLWHGNA
jgi:phosphatidylserine/phosphatidylglycerophosphate/cardiolipin synthase-like enzyme